MSRRLVIIGLALILLLAATGTSGASSSSSGSQDTTVLDWNRHAVEALINAPAAPVPGAGQSPPVAMLQLAMVQGAVYDAVNMIHRGYEPYLGDLPNAPRWASKQAAVATAAHHVLVGLGIAPVPPLAPAVITRLDGLYADALAGIANGAAKTAGIAAGAAAAAAMLEERTGDGRFVPFTFDVGDGAGEWRPTSGVNDPFAWVANVEPFVMKKTSQFRTDGPLDVESRAYAREYGEVKDYGGNGTTTPTLRTMGQTATAMFFTANPAEMYNRTFRTIAEDRDLSLVRQARLFATLNLAGADALIGCWDDKAATTFWRPITAIHEGDNDGNPRTAGDGNWNSLIPSPPYPDHPSGYNCITGAFMNAAKSFFGRDGVAFTLVKITPGQLDVTRDYTRFTDVVEDTIDARIWLGIHFRTPDVQGAELGRDVAGWLSEHFLEPQ
ncbi:MAG: phosphatase family protein [Acidimicrobiia bacterium]|nr:phosphatase family protein [Acidimicrobiia bacterium]